MRLEEPAKRPALAPIGVEASTLTELVFDAIKNAVADRTLPPGERLSESRIAAHLKHIGLVENTERGLSVVRESASRIREAYELRSILESHAAEYTAQRTDDATLEQLVEISKHSVALSKSDQYEEREVWDRRFHTLLAEASANSELSRAINNVFLLTWTLRLRDLPHTRVIACATDHYDIALAIQQREAVRAKELMEHHILAIMDLILAAKIEDSPEGESIAVPSADQKQSGTSSK